MRFYYYDNVALFCISSHIHVEYFPALKRETEMRQFGLWKRLG